MIGLGRRLPHTRLSQLGLATVLLALGAALVVLAASRGGEKAVVGPNTLVNQPRIVDANNSPTLARSPTNDQHLALVHRVDQPRYSAQLHWSLDGGVTWRQTPLPLPEGMDRPFAPDAGFGPDGTLFVTYLNLAGPGNVPEGLWVARSPDGGSSLDVPVRVGGRLSFQPRLVVGENGVVYLTWLQASEVGPFRLAGAPARVVASRSTDGGRTFSAPVPVSDVHRERVGAATPLAVGNRLFVLYKDFRDDRRDFENLEGPPWEEPFALVITRSEEGGDGFSSGVEVDAGVVPTRRFLVFLPEFPSLAAAGDGRLYATWTDGRHGGEDVLLRRSADGGASWSEATRVNDNPRGDHTSQYLSRVSVAAQGRVDVVFLDRRRDPGDNLTDAYLAFSRDRGQTFRNLRLSERSFDARVGPGNGGRWPVDLGSRLGLLSDRRGVVAAWTDTRLGNEATGRQDIVAARVETPSRSSGVGAWLTAAISMLAAGTGLLALVRTGRP